MNNIEKIIDGSLNKIDRSRKYAIYPYGNNGKIVRKWLETQGLYDYIFVDNNNDKLSSVKDIENPNQYIWIINTNVPIIHKEVLKEIKNIVLDDNIWDIFPQGVSLNFNPRMQVVNIVQKLKADNKKIIVAEVGADTGSTTVACLELMNETDEYYYFDFEDVIRALEAKLKESNSNNVQLFGIGNTRTTYDSYCWNLAKLYREWKKKFNETQMFDLVFLDGAHTFLHDASAACILKEMTKVGGYIILDDINWSMEKSATCNPDVNPNVLNCYPMEQIRACQVGVVTECFMDSDDRFERIDIEDNIVATYRRIK